MRNSNKNKPNDKEKLKHIICEIKNLIDDIVKHDDLFHVNDCEPIRTIYENDIRDIFDITLNELSEIDESKLLNVGLASDQLTLKINIFDRIKKLDIKRYFVIIFNYLNSFLGSLSRIFSANLLDPLIEFKDMMYISSLNNMFINRPGM